MLLPIISLILMSDGPKSCCGGDMAKFTSDPNFVAAHYTPKEFHFQPLEGTDITIKDANGKPANAFYVKPKEGSKVAIVMIHEFWGLNDFIKKEAEKLHESTGYAVLAVDLYEGKLGKTAEQASTLMANVDKARCKAIVAGAVIDLKRGDLGSAFAKIGTVGYCFGGGWSHETAIQGGANVQACAMYYGMPDDAPEALAKLKAPVLMIHATQDQWINEKVVDEFQVAMDKAGKSLKVLHYNAAHAFANPSNPRYDKTSADDAYTHLLAFYKKNLG